MARTKDKIQPCGHGSRHVSPYDGCCRRCVRDALANGEGKYIVERVADVDKSKVARAQANAKAEADAKAKREEEAALAEAGHAAA